jgi:flagellin-specific chaperone FliS
MKVILFFAFLVAIVSANELRAVQNVTVDDYILMVKGLLEGLNVKEDMNKIIKCIDQVPAAVHVLIEAIKKMKDMHIKNIKEIVEAIIQIIGALREIVDDILPCAESSEEIKKLIEKFSNIDFNKLIANLMMKLIKMVPEIMDAKKCIDEMKWEPFGKHVGKAIYILLFED